MNSISFFLIAKNKSLIFTKVLLIVLQSFFTDVPVKNLSYEEKLSLFLIMKNFYKSLTIVGFDFY